MGQLRLHSHREGLQLLARMIAVAVAAKAADVALRSWHTCSAFWLTCGRCYLRAAPCSAAECMIFVAKVSMLPDIQFLDYCSEVKREMVQRYLRDINCEPLSIYVLCHDEYILDHGIVNYACEVNGAAVSLAQSYRDTLDSLNAAICANIHYSGQCSHDAIASVNAAIKSSSCPMHEFYIECFEEEQLEINGQPFSLEDIESLRCQ